MVTGAPAGRQRAHYAAAADEIISVSGISYSDIYQSQRMPEPQECAYPRPAAPPWAPDDGEPHGQQQPRVLLAPHRTSEPRRAVVAPTGSSSGSRAEASRRDAGGGDAVGGGPGSLVGSPVARIAPGADEPRGSGDGGREASGRSRASAMRRCKSMPATPTVTKKGRGGSGQSHHKGASALLPKSTAAAAAGAGSIAAKVRKKGGCRKMVLPFSYGINDPRLLHVEQAEGPCCPEFLPPAAPIAGVA